MPTRIVDIHPHVISADEKTCPRDPLGGMQSLGSREWPTSHEQLLAAMDEAGVAKAAIVHSSACCGFDNPYCMDAVAAHPERFTGVGSVDMLAADATDKIRCPNLEEGLPYTGAEPLFALAKHSSIYLKPSSMIIRQTRAGHVTSESFLVRVINEFGAQRIASDSNFPACPGSLKEIVTDNQPAVEWLPEEDKEWIFNRTASQMYPALV